MPCGHGRRRERAHRHEPEQRGKGRSPRELPALHERGAHRHERAQRAGLFLRDVAYRLHADLEVRSDRSDPEPPQKFFAMFERRSEAGQCVNQPYLGCREFSVSSFRLVTDAKPQPTPIAEDRDLGWMLYDMDFTDAADPKPMFFRARMQSGVIECDWRDVAKVDGSGVAR